MTDNPLPSIAPDLAGANTPVHWKRYRESLEQWSGLWDEMDKSAKEPGIERLSPGSRDALSEIFRNHPEYKGQTVFDVMLALRREARDAQLLYKLWIKYPKPGELNPSDRLEIMAARIAAMRWSYFGGGLWETLDSQQLLRYFESVDQDNPGTNLELDHHILATNRSLYEYYGDYLHGQGKKPTLPGYVQFVREGELYPDETRGAFYLRKSRPYAVALAILAFLAAWLLNNSDFNAVAFIFLLYLFLSFPMYSRLQRLLLPIATRMYERRRLHH